MKLTLRFCGLLWLFAALPAVWAQFAPSVPEKIAKIQIRHIGPPAVSDEFVRSNIRVKVGDPYLPPAVNDDVRNLYATRLFYNIRVDVTNAPEGLVLTYAVQGNPRLTDIKFQGNTKYSDAKLRKKIASKAGEPLDESKIFADSQTIQKTYQKAGYPRTEVKPVESIDENAGRA